MTNIDQDVEKLIKKHGIPSMSVMILDGDKVVLQVFKGVRKIDSNDEVTSSDSYHLGSCGKAFTAALVLKLMDEGKLDLEESITKYLKNLDSQKFGDIKIKQLLSHTSGIKANVEGEAWSKIYTFDITASKARDLAVEHLAKSAKLNSPGKSFLYSNLGYIVLGQIVENIENKSFEKVLEEKLFKPFKMSSCSFGPVGRHNDVAGPWAHKFADGKYSPVSPKVIESDNPPAMSSAGGISCTQRDWARFISFTLGIGENSNYLSNKTKQYITKVNLDDYTYGAWGKVKRDWSDTILVHSGSNTLNYSYAIVGIDKKFAFLINTNSPAQEAVLEIVPYLKDYYLSLK